MLTQLDYADVGDNGAPAVKLAYVKVTVDPVNGVTTERIFSEDGETWYYRTSVRIDAVMALGRQKRPRKQELTIPVRNIAKGGIDVGNAWNGYSYTPGLPISAVGWCLASEADEFEEHLKKLLQMELQEKVLAIKKTLWVLETESVNPAS